MKPFEVHPLSALAGAALLGLTLVAAGAAQDKRVQVDSVEPLGNATQSLRIVNPIEVIGIPDPRDMLVIKGEDGPYVVPTGKLFVLTGLGPATGTSNLSAHLYVDGVVEAYAIDAILCGVSVMEVPRGFIVSSGKTITVGDPNARAWGYLIDA